MSDLSELRASPAPRPAALARRLARRGAPTWGFVAYGVLYGFFVFGTVPALVGLGLGHLLAEVTGTPLPSWAGAIVVLGWLAASVGVWLPFVAWVRRRRAQLVTLGRDGALVEGRVLRVGWNRLGSSARSISITVEVMIDGRARRLAVRYGGHPPDVVEGSVQPVLQHPSVAFAMVFAIDGTAVAGRWTS